MRGVGLALFASVVVCAQSCLVPQSVEPITVQPHPAPRFDLSVTALPPYLTDVPILTLYRQGSKDAVAVPPCHCQIHIPQLTIIEDDPTVSLTVHWFVDYDLTKPFSTAPWPLGEQTLAGNFDNPNLTTRKINDFYFDADSFGIPVSGTHTLEVVVGETDGFETGGNVPFPNRTMKPGYSPAVYKFVINVIIEQTIATCPTDPPSEQVCQ
jgi:hypothetical protein